MRSFLIGLFVGAAGVLFGLNYYGHISLDDFMPGSATVEDGTDMLEQPVAEEPAAEALMEEGEAVVEEDMGDVEE
jgi:hypothetical protein